ncbi:hypothetical protein OJAV_G00220820 [Oryzias javanicus]|uniref:Uncharacterized protein n=1 Tax=Oryzias javanicus TaxID=123683 RepID=A0A3S2MCH4_ORYJA|nr:hypothetical protein OJAV_G00220820 [Oryzias javanicus]
MFVTPSNLKLQFLSGSCPIISGNLRLWSTVPTRLMQLQKETKTRSSRNAASFSDLDSVDCRGEANSVT